MARVYLNEYRGAVEREWPEIYVNPNQIFPNTGGGGAERCVFEYYIVPRCIYLRQSSRPTQWDKTDI